MNFARRDKCYKCGLPRPRQDSSVKQVGKEFAEKSRGLFNPDDWECKGCGNVNWARRTHCNVCNAPKISTRGERTGYGGGYMERDEVVDYKRHEDSDDEFDEFGIRKKKYRKTNAGESVGDKITRESHSDADDQVSEHNEEDEESGDEEDLSKYDIVGSEDESGVKEAPSSTKNGDQKSNSRSSDSSSDSETSSSSTSGSSSSTSGSDSSESEDEDKNEDNS